MPDTFHLTHERKHRLAVGLIAGTSLDGVDAALVELSRIQERPQVRLLAFITTPYPTDLHARLLRVASGGSTTISELAALNYQVGDAFAQAAIKVCKRGKVRTDDLTVIASHGQTVFHQGRGIGRRRACTLQIGEPALIAELTGAAVVADFRAGDIVAGGEGAPLVPMVDYLLLRDRRQGTVALNIGGIANVTTMPAGTRSEDVIGFDTGPGNMVMDGLMRHFTRGREQYDSGGRLASRGRVLEPILSEALRHPFFAKRPPKSAGREQFGDEFLKAHFLGWPRSRFEDLVCTAAELTARTIASALDRFVFRSLQPGRKLHRLVVSGGGAYNKALVARLKTLVPGLFVQRSDDLGLPANAKEAIAFAVLGDRTLHGLPGNLPSVTGARKAVVLGKITRP